MTALILLKDFLETQIELWRPVRRADGYDVSNLGRVRSWRQRSAIKGMRGSVSVRRTKPNILILQKKDTGRVIVGLRVNRKLSTFQVHHLVAEAFIPNPNCLPEINHRTGIFVDNRVGNLEWSTQRDNIDHAVEFDLVAFGERQGSAKLTVSKVLEIRKRCAEGEPQRKIAASLGVSQVLVGMVNRRQVWRRVA